MNGIPLWEHIHIPDLLVKGGLSERLSPEGVAQIRRHCRQVAVAGVPNAEHHVMLDNPPRFVRALSSFLSED